MYLTADLNNMLQTRRASGSPPVFDESQVEQTQFRIQFSANSQIQLNSLREYMGRCRSVLYEIKTDLSRFRKNHDDSELLSETAARLCRLCLEANGRGFRCLYEVAFELQKTLLRSDGCWDNSGFWDAVDRSLYLLTALVEQCEIDLRKRLAVQHAIECLRQVSA